MTASAVRRAPDARKQAGRPPAHLVLPPAEQTTGASRGLPGLVPRSTESVLRLQRSAGNAAVAQLLNPARRTRDEVKPVQRFEELEHKAIGDRAAPNVRYRLSPLVEMTHGDLLAMGDYFASPDEIARLAEHPGPGKGTIGEVYYVLFVKIRGGDEKSMMGDWFDRSAKAAADERFYRLASTNISHFPNPYTGDKTLDPRIKGERHAGPGKPIGEGATYRDGHLRAIRRALELGKAGQPVGGALAIDAFASHFLTDAFSAGHIRTPRMQVAEYWRRKFPDFYQRFQHWLADTMADWVNHNGAQHEQAAPMSLKRSIAMSKVREALKAMPEMSLGDVVATAVHDYDSDRGVVVQVGKRRLRMVGDGKLLEPDAAPGQVKAAEDTMELAVKAVQASVADIEQAYEMGRAGVDIDAAVGRLTSIGKGLFGGERLVPTPVPDDQLTAADRSLRWHFGTVGELFADPRMRKAITLFANNKATMFDAIMENPEFDQVAKDGLQVMVATPMSSGDSSAVIALFSKILHYPR